MLHPLDFEDTTPQLEETQVLLQPMTPPLFWMLPLLLLQPHKIEKSYTQKVTVDHKNPPPVLTDVILKEKPSVAIKVTATHEKDVKATATKDR
jgi:hypothetical protein